MPATSFCRDQTTSVVNYWQRTKLLLPLARGLANGLARGVELRIGELGPIERQFERLIRHAVAVHVPTVHDGTDHHVLQFVLQERLAVGAIQVDRCARDGRDVER